MMEEIGGDFLLVHVRCGFSIILFALPLSSTFARAVQYTHLRETLAEFAEELGATIRHGPEAEVVSVHADPQRPSVTLKSGEIVYADVVVGADGHYWSGCTRRELMNALEQEDEHEPTGMAVYRYVRLHVLRLLLLSMNEMFLTLHTAPSSLTTTWTR